MGGRWRDGEMERWRDGEMERWRDDCGVFTHKELFELDLDSH